MLLQVNELKGIKVGDTVSFKGVTSIGDSRQLALHQLQGRKGVVKQIIIGHQAPYVVEILGLKQGPIMYHPVLGNIVSELNMVRHFRADDLILESRKSNRYNIQEEQKKSNKSNANELDMRVITQGKKVIVIMKDPNKKGYKKGVASCHHEDKFDFHTGLQIAMARALGEKEPLVNGSEINHITYTDEIDGKGVKSNITIAIGKNKYHFPVVGEK